MNCSVRPEERISAEEYRTKQKLNKVEQSLKNERLQ